MKNKKLFAILTLVCFMMTLMPVAAFATPGDTVTVTADKVTAGTPFYAWNTDAGNSNATATAYYYLVDEDGVGVAVADKQINKSGKFTIKTPGKYEVYAVKSDQSSDDVHKIMSEATMYAKDKVALIEANHSDKIMDDYATVKVVAPTVTNTITLSTSGAFTSVNGNVYELSGVNAIASDNGFTSPTFTANLLANGTTVVKGAELTYTTNSGYLKVQKIDSVTDKHGDAEFKLAATKAGDYKVNVRYGKASAVINVTVKETTVAGVSVVAEPTRPLALNTPVGDYTGIVFKLVDANGVVITKADETAFGDTSLLRVAVIEQPADADLDTVSLDLEYESDESGWVLNAPAGVLFDEEGRYTFKVTLANGLSATASVKIAEFDEPVAMNLTYTTPTIALNDTASVKALVLVDKNGTMKPYNVAPLNSYTYTFVADGKALQSINETTGAVTSVIPADREEAATLVGTKINVMAICEELGLTANAELLVAAAVDELKYASTEADVAVNNTLVVNTVDAMGNIVKMSTVDNTTVNDPDEDTAYVYVLDAPENAVYDIDATVDTNKKRVLVNFTASAVGEYKVQLVLAVKDNGNVVKYLSSVETITVGGVVDDGAKSVIVLSIGSNNMIKNGSVDTLLAAPEIKDGRTMIPMRAGLEAFGATVNWDEANSTVTAEMNGVKVVMTVGSLDYTVNGKAMKADSAPYIKNGSTMVPAVFFTNAFGIVATPLYDANGVCDVLFSK